MKTEGLKSELLISQLQKTIEKQEETINSLYGVIDSFHLIKELLVNDIKEVCTSFNSVMLSAEQIDSIVNHKVKEKGAHKIKKKFQYEIFEMIKEHVYFEKDLKNGGISAKFSYVENKKLWDKKLDLLLHLFRITHNGIEKEELNKTEEIIRKLYSGKE
jgi:hypothetical protein